jgi:hypothetical protein
MKNYIQGENQPTTCDQKKNALKKWVLTLTKNTKEWTKVVQ